MIDDHRHAPDAPAPFLTAMGWLPSATAKLDRYRTTGPVDDWFPPSIKAIECGQRYIAALTELSNVLGHGMPEPLIDGDGDAGLMIRWRHEGNAEQATELLIDQHGKSRLFQQRPVGNWSKPEPNVSELLERVREIQNLQEPKNA